tara:strand:+ start:931 stop:1161 length:231 start_codon:yes stop_codon:yes gene_type:complete
MDVYLHTVLATGAILLAYYGGRWSVNEKVETIIASMLDTLEYEGFVATSLDKNGDKELVPISELVAKALKEAKKTT